MSRQKEFKHMSTSLSITVDLVTTDGRIDIDASAQAFRASALKRQAELETEQSEIAQAVSDLFDTHRKAIPMPVLGSLVAQKLNAEPENFKVLSDRALDYIRANSQERKGPDGTVTKHDDSEFVIGKGKNGGCYRRADKPVPAAPAAK
jgi:hypothetical protein